MTFAAIKDIILDDKHVLKWEDFMLFDVFISYAHKDRELRDKLGTALSTLRNQILLTIGLMVISHRVQNGKSKSLRI